MNENKYLDEKIGVKHISKPKDLPKLKDTKNFAYHDPKYPYDIVYPKVKAIKKVKNKVSKRQKKLTFKEKIIILLKNLWKI